MLILQKDAQIILLGKWLNNTVQDQILEERENSRIIHLKKLNNWIKSVLIQLYAKKGDAVLDLAWGNGGDLSKWDKAKIGYYVGIDVAEGSIEDCQTCYNGDADHHQRR
ncbi:hypothetical protein Leryth_005981 [Lithospermum erythrorhizon]|nr:hypothetical protein Leryth_005981 [Lithospermum erythrorhizon]